MTHRASPDFWACYHGLPVAVRLQADRAFALLRQDPRHPSLHFRRVGRYWSARVGLHYWAPGVEIPEGGLWFWIVAMPSMTGRLTNLPTRGSRVCEILVAR